jgi:Fe-S cluster assembly protein SufD
MSATLDKNKFDAKQWYLANFSLFETNLDGSRESAFHVVRKKAISAFAELGFPTPRNEEWKYTSVAPILEHKFKQATEPAKLTKKVLKNFVLKGVDRNLAVFVNGQYNHTLSEFAAIPKGVTVDGLKQILQNRPELVQKYLANFATFEKESFTALNTAFTHDGLCVFVPDGMIVEEPVVVLYLSNPRSDAVLAYPRNLILVGKGSQVRFVECYYSVSAGTYFNNAVSEIFLDGNAVVDHIKLQEENTESYHIANTQIHQEQRSSYTSVNIDLGGALVRNNLNVRLNAENCEALLYGFFMGNGTQHLDNHTFIDHAKPHCFSNELYKGILDDKARGVFNGKIMVRPDAQKTNALQSNKTLLLTNDAAIYAKPQLEIFADDVKCTHGATIGQLDDEALFYLRARGIGEDVAAAMLRYAFAIDVFEKIKIEPLREVLATKVFERLKKS